MESGTNDKQLWAYRYVYGSNYILWSLTILDILLESNPVHKYARVALCKILGEVNPPLFFYQLLPHTNNCLQVKVPTEYSNEWVN